MDNRSSAAVTAETLKRVLNLAEQRQAELLSEYFVYRFVERGAVLFKSGAVAEGCYLLVGGLLAVSRDTGFSDRSQIVALLRPETVVGEGALSGRASRTATVSAIADSELLLLTVAQFQRLSEAIPKTALALSAYLLSISSRRLEKCSERLVHVL